MPVLTRKMLSATLNDLGVIERIRQDDINITSTPDTLTIGSVSVLKLKGNPELVPSTLFFENKNVIHNIFLAINLTFLHFIFLLFSMYL